MYDRTLRSTLVIVALLLATGCTPAISKALRERADNNLGLKTVIQDPEAHMGKTIIWGGVIVSTRNTKDGSLLEIVQKPLDIQLGPKRTDDSSGRFLALYEDFLDPTIYDKGRNVTVGGEIGGRRVQPLDEIEYTYPLVVAREVYLWQQPRARPSYPEPYPFYHYYWYGPWVYRGYWGP